MRARHGTETLANSSQEEVAGRVTVGVVVRLEAVEVHQHEEQRRVAASSPQLPIQVGEQLPPGYPAVKASEGAVG